MAEGRTNLNYELKIAVIGCFSRYKFKDRLTRQPGDPAHLKCMKDPIRDRIRSQRLTSCRFLSLPLILSKTPGSTKLLQVFPNSPPPAPSPCPSGLSKTGAIGPEIDFLGGICVSEALGAIIRLKNPLIRPPDSLLPIEVEAAMGGVGEIGLGVSVWVSWDVGRTATLEIGLGRGCAFELAK